MENDKLKMRKKGIITVKVQKEPKNKNYRERFYSDDIHHDDHPKLSQMRQRTQVVSRPESSKNRGSLKIINFFESQNKKKFDFDRFNS
jgi:hypothetical protein